MPSTKSTHSHPSRKMTPIFSKFSSLKKNWDHSFEQMEHFGKSIELTARNRYYATIERLRKEEDKLEARVEKLKSVGKEKAAQAREELAHSMESLSEKIKKAQAEIKKKVS